MYVYFENVFELNVLIFDQAKSQIEYIYIYNYSELEIIFPFKFHFRRDRDSRWDIFLKKKKKRNFSRITLSCNNTALHK